MSDYIAVDCGKYNTKISAFDTVTKARTKFKFRTKISDGTFDDDMLERGTFIVQINDGPVYKIGNAAKTEPEMETSKKTEIHRVCTLSAIALAGASGEVNVVIGIPLQIAGIPVERMAYKDYIIGDGTYKVRVKTDSDGPIMESEFSFKKRLVYPEGLGVLFEYPTLVDGPTAVIDIGNLNTNNTYTDGFNIIADASFTDELGGKVLISGLAQELTSELGMRCDDNLAASTLLRPYEKRFLRPKNGDKEIEEKSRSIIDNYLLEHTKAIKRKCDTRHWPLDFMGVICVGGTARLLEKEIKEVFGTNAFIPENPEFVNVNGFLKKMCADADINLAAEGE